MKRALLSFSLALAAVFAPNTPYRVADVAMRTAIPSTSNCIPSTGIMVVPPEQHEVHAVVVDMPQRASLAYASPETWGCLPMSDPSYEQTPYEQAPTKPVLQVALN
jgi:hypothetical protein